MKSNRDDFSPKTRELLAKRVGYMCSNPNCRKLTIGPNIKSDKTVSIGVAAHISAAARGGKRYDEKLSSDERKEYNNGIWLCENCAKLIDSDEEKYSLEVIEDWKKRAEETAFKQIETNTQESNDDFRKKIEEDDLKNDFSQIHKLKNELHELAAILNNYDFISPFPFKIVTLIDTIDISLDGIVFNDGKIKECIEKYFLYTQEFSDMLHYYTKEIPGTNLCIMKRIEPYGDIIDEDFYDVKDKMYQKRKFLYNTVNELLSIEKNLKLKLMRL